MMERSGPDITADAIPGYRILDYLGGGGMGDVYAALHLSLDRRVALKIARLPSSESVVGGASLLSEARVIAKLEHPHIVKVYDCFAFNGQVVMVLEYLDGLSLEELLEPAAVATLPGEYRKLFGEDGLLRPDWIAGAAIQVAEALSFAHAAGVFHLDIKPSNIFVLRSGDIKLLDFNIAHDLHARGMTRTGTLIGSPPYMSPEQIQQEVVDGRSDLYSLGCVMYHLLTGELPFNDTSQILICIQHLQNTAREPHEINPLIPRYLRDCVVRLMEKERENRFNSAEELRDYLIPHLLTTAGIRHGSPLGEGGSRKTMIFGVVACAVLALGSAVYFLRPTLRPEVPELIAPPVAEFIAPPPIAMPPLPESEQWKPLETWMKQAIADDRLVRDGVYLEPRLEFDPLDSRWEFFIKNENDFPVEVSAMVAGSKLVSASSPETTDSLSLSLELSELPLAASTFGSAYGQDRMNIQPGRSLRLAAATMRGTGVNCSLASALRLTDVRFAARAAEASEAFGADEAELQFATAARNAVAFPFDASALGSGECRATASGLLYPRPSKILDSPDATEAARNLERFLQHTAKLSVSKRVLSPAEIRFTGVETDAFLGILEFGFEVEQPGTLDLSVFILEGSQTVTIIQGTERIEETRSLNGMLVNRELAHAQLRRTIKIDLPEPLKRPISDPTLRFEQTRRVEIRRMLVFASSDVGSQETRPEFISVKNYSRQF